jgi:hypothetical protein
VRRTRLTVELAIRDLKDGFGLDPAPTGNFHATSVWLQCTVLAHNLIRWTAAVDKVCVDASLPTGARTLLHRGDGARLQPQQR